MLWNKISESKKNSETYQQQEKADSGGKSKIE